MSSKNVKININGQEVEAEEGASVLQVAIDHGIMVPHFCYHPGIGVDGNCRLCLVEVEGMPKLATSCNLPAKEGMVVRTESKPVEKARNGVLEFILLNHPLDCPFCDKGGECPLQNYTYESGQTTTRFEFEKNHKPKHQAVGEHILLDKERCVLCSRCVRFGRDLAGHEEFQITSRGSKSEIFVPQEDPLRSKFTGNYADICPVGALTTREFRFKARPWEMKKVDTVCGDCSLGCSVQAWKKGENVLRLTPRIEPSVNDWWLCDRGRFSVHRRKNEERVLGVMKKSESGSFEKASSVQDLFNAMAQRNPESIGLKASSSMTNEEFFELRELSTRLRGAKVYAPVRSEVATVYRALQIAQTELVYPTDLEASRSTLLIGEAIEESHPVMAIRFRTQVRKKGLKLFLAHQGTSELDGISTRFEVSSWDAFFKDLPSMLEKHGVDQVYLSDRAITTVNAPSIVRMIESKTVKVALLFSGANDRGILDQCDASVSFMGDVEGAGHEAWLWYGDVMLPSVVESSGLLVHAVQFLTDAHPKASWLVPNEPFFERSGTYTNHFGKVQTLRKASSLLSKGTPCRVLLKNWSVSLGQASRTLEESYRAMAAKNAKYPPSMKEIPETKKTYHHYEGTSWR